MWRTIDGITNLQGGITLTHITNLAHISAHVLLSHPSVADAAVIVHALRTMILTLKVEVSAAKAGVRPAASRATVSKVDLKAFIRFVTPASSGR